MFSLKRISKVFLSVLCMLSCVFGFSFVSAKKGDISELRPIRSNRAIFATKEVDIGEWIMIKNEGPGKKVPTRVKFVRYEDGRIVAHEKGGRQRYWFLRDGWRPATLELMEKGPNGLKKIEEFEWDFGDDIPHLRLNRFLEVRSLCKGVDGYITLRGEDYLDFYTAGRLPVEVKILMACFLPDGPLSYVSDTWKDCGVPV